MAGNENRWLVGSVEFFFHQLLPGRGAESPPDSENPQQQTSMDCVVSIPSFSVRNDGRPNEGPATDSITCHTEDEAPVTRIRLTPTPHLAGALHPHHHPAAVAVAAPARGPARGQLAVPERAACVAAACSVQQTVPPGVYVCMFSRRCNVCKYFFYSWESFVFFIFAAEAACERRLPKRPCCLSALCSSKATEHYFFAKPPALVSW